MKISMKSLAAIGIIAGIFFASPGCKEYKVDVVLNGDGTGTRTAEMRASTIGEDDFEIGLDEFRALFGLDEKRGWTMEREVKTTTDEVEMYVFTLGREAKSISAWRAMSGDIDVRGTLDRGPLENISFHNDIEVERSDDSVITYRETLTWHELKERAADLEAAFFAERLALAYPFLSKRDRDDIRSFLAGMITVAWYAEEVADDKMKDELYTQAARDYIAYLIGERHPDRDVSGLGERLDRIMQEEGDEFLDRILKEKLPGVYLAGHISITFTVTMPGKILDSNATSVEGNTALWKYDLMLAPLNHPVELYIKSEIQH